MLIEELIDLQYDEHNVIIKDKWLQRSDYELGKRHYFIVRIIHSGDFHHGVHQREY